ncbi:hypothetical protein BGE01nite_37280 [Brevifollis gellanilyticus]|uniref:DUF5666 domain-containing protein n=1 Tax=Brevifollis gellanilyticus TaxID=748831 RepID=A0A512MCI5_9BACT|nr:hypothetical protein BGE01nite_37280 [Brevifollis gellanilyticus]
MNSRNKLYTAIFASFLLFCCASVAQARPPRGVVITGVVKSVDHQTRTISFAPEGGPVRRLTYATRARFWHGESESLPDHLKAGMRVQVRVHNPLVGADYVTQVVLISQEPIAERTSL